MKNSRFLIAFLLVTTAFFFTACEEDIADETVTKSSTFAGTQVVPSVTSTGVATANYTYNKSNRTLTYGIVWNTLVDSVTNMGIYGPALRGQNGTLIQSFTLSTVQKRKEGSFSGNVYMDEQIFKEADLLAGKYYFLIRSKAFPNGEVRAQIEF